MRCGTQTTDQPEELVPESVMVYDEGVQEADKQTDQAEDNANILTEYQAKQIIVEADNALHTIMEEADIYNNKEQPEEEEVRAYLSDYFDQNILDYVLYVYQIKMDEGKCFYKYYDHYRNFYMDTEESMQITEQGESYCNINVSFVHRWERKWDEEKVTVRIEKNSNDRWIITTMNQWYNDFRFNYMREMDYEPVYMTKDMSEWMIREFGTDENGEKIQLRTRNDGAGYILPDSSECKIEEQMITALSRYEMFLAVQEIYARNGKKFDDIMLYGYFHVKPWYKPYEKVFDESSLSETERYNISQLATAGNLGEQAQAAYGNRYGKEEKMPGQLLGAEEASCIIGDAFDSLGEVFVAKDENKIDERSDDVEEYY
ncbi:MAG: YARHG domain-containing protein, partial [Lachnospiraceae bacterium]|nr:YARHG domain-containing protein [Lachnospiraceae bacterium]